MRHAKKQGTMNHTSKKVATETAYKNDQMLALMDKAFKVTFVNMFQKLKEVMLKEVKEGMNNVTSNGEHKQREIIYVYMHMNQMNFWSSKEQ